MKMKTSMPTSPRPPSVVSTMVAMRCWWRSEAACGVHSAGDGALAPIAG